MSRVVPGPGTGARAAFVANFEGAADDAWYFDRGATHHLTNMAN